MYTYLPETYRKMRGKSIVPRAWKNTNWACVSLFADTVTLYASSEQVEQSLFDTYC